MIFASGDRLPRPASACPCRPPDTAGSSASVTAFPATSLSTYRCPFCRGAPLRLRGAGRSAPPPCPSCGRPLRRSRVAWAGPLLAATLTGLGLVVAVAPQLLDQAVSQAIDSSLLPRLRHRFEPSPPPEEQPVALLGENLFERLSEADRRWIPTAEWLPDGGVRYLYKRRLGEPELSVAEIRERMRRPPRHDAERQAIRELLEVLQVADVRLVLEPPIKVGAAGEWDHAARTMRIDPAVVEKGTLEFFKVLNHEAIHVAQSCAAGSLRARPRLLGMTRDLDPELADQLEDPLYADVSPQERSMEREAYAGQDQRGLGEALVQAHCSL